MLLACNRCWSLRKNCCGIIIKKINDVPRHDNYSLFLSRRKLLSSSISLSSDDDVVSSYPISISRFSIQLRSFFFLLGLWLNSQIFVFLSLSLCPCFSSSFGCSFFLRFYYTAIKLLIIVLNFWFVACLMVFIGGV